MLIADQPCAISPCVRENRSDVNDNSLRNEPRFLTSGVDKIYSREYIIIQTLELLNKSVDNISTIGIDTIRSLEFMRIV